MSGKLKILLELVAIDVEPLLGPIPQGLSCIDLVGSKQRDDQRGEVNPYFRFRLPTLKCPRPARGCVKLITRRARRANPPARRRARLRARALPTFMRRLRTRTVPF